MDLGKGDYNLIDVLSQRVHWYVNGKYTSLAKIKLKEL